MSCNFVYQLTFKDECYYDNDSIGHYKNSKKFLAYRVVDYMKNMKCHKSSYTKKNITFKMHKHKYSKYKCNKF